MNYYLDTEFLEGPQKTFFGKTKSTIDLISIALVDETGREFYAINKDFNLKEAWNRHQLVVNKHFPQGPEYYKEYWIRDNVLRKIFDELIPSQGFGNDRYVGRDDFSYRNLKRLIKLNGMSLPIIANAICAFIYGNDCEGSGMSAIEMAMKYEISDKTKLPVFYAYYADYDWVGFCWIFGRMMSLPKGFPMYCRDLKQILDEKVDKMPLIINSSDSSFKEGDGYTFDKKLGLLTCSKAYPKQTNEHNALDDAKWNKQLHKFLNTLT